MATLSNDFERKAREAFADAAAEADAGRVLADAAEQNFREYASANGYDIDHIWTDAEITTTRQGDTIQTRIEWPGLTALFEYGVEPHVINGNPLLTFYYDAIDQWISTESVNWGSETGGIPESRAIRNAIDQLRGQIQRRGPGGQFR